MPTPAAKSSSAKARSGRTRRTSRRDPLAISLLKKDHREVDHMFDEYEQLGSEAEKLALFNKIALALKHHSAPVRSGGTPSTARCCRGIPPAGVSPSCGCARRDFP